MPNFRLDSVYRNHAALDTISDHELIKWQIAMKKRFSQRNNQVKHLYMVMPLKLKICINFQNRVYSLFIIFVYLSIKRIMTFSNFSGTK